MLNGHEIVTLGKDLVSIGGYDPYSYNYHSSMYLMTCQNKFCVWHVMSQALKVARKSFVALIIPNELTDCGKSFQIPIKK